ncbi:DUF1707 domain-containing protein [Nonomuraea sp. NPDC050643]|uniref:DUF1707 SHOCT-like domain-containing protein n=1 Tax=Nonomuraea sp. NPDC050643 TaxID=3155660 RepID=UPI00340EEF70
MNRATAHVSDQDRDTAVELVQQAYADGRLTPAELEQRLELALTATSFQELRPIVGDLPDETVRLGSTGGQIVRAGDWQVPRHLRIDSEYGRVRLDLSRALVRHARVDIELRLTYGGATIILPAGASANADGVRTEWGSVRSKVAGTPRPGRLHVQITGELPYGRLTIRTARR